MPSIEQKIIKGKPFFYLSEQVRILNKYKKNQVYIGKSIPKNLLQFYKILEEKEISLFSKNINNLFIRDNIFNETELKKIETLRIKWKYKQLTSTPLQIAKFWREFAIQFVFESNAIEGSRLSEKEVFSIVNKKYVKKSIKKKEIQEVVNSIKAFEFIKSPYFKLNQRSIIKLHSLLTKGLGIRAGYKKFSIIVNNKATTPPGEVRTNMALLLNRFNSEIKEKIHPLAVCADFHQRFEKIHPFEDGNGRIGRLIFNWMLFKRAYTPILFRKKNHTTYFHALDKADENRKEKWYRFVIDVYKKSLI